ncbi:unnamed protein product [Linum trigynum]|uniref:FBD domain-containing protein n=1 Tax=Linum trigynum TaxID=586398 RepID=A0AAV2F366_9ROSI
MRLFVDLPPPNLITLTSPSPNLMMLKQLRMDEICLSSVRDVWACLLLIEHSPKLQELIIGTRIGANTNVDVQLRVIQRMCESRTYKPKRLKQVELYQLHGLKREMCFIRWLLSALPMLDKMLITFSASSLPHQQIQTLKELNGFQRPSSKAQVIIL